MKRYFIVTVTLTIICLVCAFGIAALNGVTAPIIEENTALKEENLCKKIFADYDKTNSKVSEEGFSNDSILKVIEVVDSNNNSLGYIYTVSGKNSYGQVTLLVGINEACDTLVDVEFLTNTESFKSKVNSFLEDNFDSGNTLAEIDAVDTACGATYGANLVKSLIQIAFADASSKGGAR